MSGEGIGCSTTSLSMMRTYFIVVVLLNFLMAQTLEAQKNTYLYSSELLATNTENINGTFTYLCENGEEHWTKSTVSDADDVPFDGIEVKFKDGFPFFGETVRQLFISPNGGVHLNDGVPPCCERDTCLFMSNTWPRCNFDNAYFDLIAPFITDFNPSAQGQFDSASLSASLSLSPNVYIQLHISDICCMNTPPTSHSYVTRSHLCMQAQSSTPRCATCYAYATRTSPCTFPLHSKARKRRTYCSISSSRSTRTATS